MKIIEIKPPITFNKKDVPRISFLFFLCKISLMTISSRPNVQIAMKRKTKLWE